MKSKCNDCGFTLMETLVAVAITVILLGLGFISLQNHQRTLKQLELDEAAREIYIAAQNHLSVAKSQGVLEKRIEKGQLHEESNADGRAVTQHYCYYINNSTGKDSQLTDRAEVLYDMLPQFSLDETIRSGGNYAIEYDLASGTVVNVFYSDQSNLSGVIFTDADYDNLIGSSQYRGEGAEYKNNRLNYNSTGKVIGWYGGDDLAGVDRVKLFAPKVELINAERLEVKVSFPVASIQSMEKSEAQAKLRVYMYAVDDPKRERMILINSVGEPEPVPVSDFLTADVDVTETPAVFYKTYILDDITTQGNAFNEMWAKENEDGIAIYPGEDVGIYAKVGSSKVYAADADSRVYDGPKPEGNSLFGHSTKFSNGGVADIRNIRHLENLDPTVSGYGVANANDDEDVRKIKNGIRVTSAVQAEDLSWTGFRKAVSPDSPEKVSVFYYTKDAKPGEERTLTTPGTFKPVSPILKSAATSYLQSYDGGGKKITNVIVNQSSGNAGVFGGLVGIAENEVTIKNVLVCNSEKDDAFVIAGADSVGGLVGYLKNGSIENSAAAVYVKSTGGDAGGLVGKTEGTVTISNSYSGGHTKDGAYGDETDDTSAGRFNVYAPAGNAGGLVGDAANATITNCYSTCSATGKTNAGGLVGNISAGSVNNCYSTGLVKLDGVGGGKAASDTKAAGDDKLKAGAFVGTVGSAKLGDVKPNKYFSLINMYDEEGKEREDVRIVGSQEDEKTGESVIAFDAVSGDKTATQMYNEFMTGTSTANPYDDYLKTKSASIFPMKTIADLASLKDDQPKHLTSHYGDWPTPETLIVNKKGA